VNVISTAPVETLEDAHRTSSVLGTVTKETGEVSAEAQVCTVDVPFIFRNYILTSFTDFSYFA
jgi:hypothetical protein